MILFKKEESQIKVGDTVYIQRKVKRHRFKQNLGTEDTVISVPYKTTIQLEADNVWSLRDLIKKPK